MLEKSNRQRPRRHVRRANTAYVLIVRGTNGRLRAERFTDVAAYRARLASLEQSDDRGVSVEELARLLDA